MEPPGDASRPQDAPAGRCGVCGRERSLTPSGVPVSCCAPWEEPRTGPRPPERAGGAGEVVHALRAEWARRTEGLSLPATSPFVGCLTAAGIATVTLVTLLWLHC